MRTDDDLCPRCDAAVGESDNFCRACGWSLQLDSGPDGVETAAIVPTHISPPTAQPQALLPALRADLAPLVPIVRGVATILATAAVADWATRQAAPALAQRVPAILQPKTAPRPAPTPQRTVRFEERVIVRQWTSVES